MVPQHNVTRPAFQTTFRDISPRIKNIEALPGFCLVPPCEQGDNHPSSGGQERPETDIPVLLLPERKQRGCRLLEITRSWREWRSAAELLSCNCCSSLKLFLSRFCICFEKFGAVRDEILILEKLFERLKCDLIEIASNSEFWKRMSTFFLSFLFKINYPWINYNLSSFRYIQDIIILTEEI